MIWSFRGD